MSLTETVKLPTYRKQIVPVTEKEAQQIRDIVTRAVFSVWNLEGRPTDLAEVYRFYRTHLPESAKVVWSKRTVDRRVEEAATPEHGAKIVCVTAGIYQVNPELFLEKSK